MTHDGTTGCAQSGPLMEITESFGAGASRRADHGNGDERAIWTATLDGLLA